MRSSFDSVKQAFAVCMLSSSTMNRSSLCSHPAISLPSTPSVGGLTERSVFSTEGWALAVHTSFRFKKRQKNFLFKAFADDEDFGKKASPEEVHQNMNFFDPMDYCSDCQIKSLFSHWNPDLQSSTLHDLAENITSKGTFCLLKQIINK